METINVNTLIGADGMVRIEVPCHSPPGPAQVVMLIRPEPSMAKLRWRDFYGLARDLWHDEDAQDYVNRLRDEWHHEPS